jgi:hypothetical protein
MRRVQLHVPTRDPFLCAIESLGSIARSGNQPKHRSPLCRQRLSADWPCGLMTARLSRCSPQHCLSQAHYFLHQTLMGKAKRYIVAFTIQDGEHQYYGDTWAHFDHEPTEREQIEAVAYEQMSWRSEKEMKEVIASAIKHYEDEGYFEENRGYRLFSEIRVEQSESEDLNTDLLECCKLALEFWDHKNPGGDAAFDRIKNAVAQAESDA